MNCQNCGSKLSCGCQKRIASNGREVCGTCVTNFENQLKLKTQSETQVVKPSLSTDQNKTNNT
jgi:hypothetical protein